MIIIQNTNTQINVITCNIGQHKKYDYHSLIYIPMNKLNNILLLIIPYITSKKILFFPTYL